MKNLLLIVIATLGVGCAIATTPVGSDLAEAIDEDWHNATWLDGNGNSFRTLVIDRNAGLVKISDVKLSGFDEIPAASVVVRSGPNGSHLINVRDPFVQGEDLYGFWVAHATKAWIVLRPLGGMDVRRSAGITGVNILDRTWEGQSLAHLRHIAEALSMVFASYDLMDGRQLQRIMFGSERCEAGMFETPHQTCESILNLFDSRPQFVFVRARD